MRLPLSSEENLTLNYVKSKKRLWRNFEVGLNAFCIVIWPRAYGD